jgi:hypothetical protein
MAATLTRGTHAQTRVSDAVRDDIAATWRMRCTLLEEKLQDATRAHTALQQQYVELSLDYKHSLNRLWALNARLPRTGKR